MIFLTECNGWVCANIEADSWEEAEAELKRMIENLELSPDTVIIGELEDETLL